MVFIGAGDRDRVPYVSALVRAGFSVDLYGSFWERFPETRGLTRGQIDVPTMRKAISAAKISLCLVRRANRDGHSMRTFEVPAVGACMLVEETEEHKEIFGKDGSAVVYFRGTNEMIEKTSWLLENHAERSRLAQAAQSLIVSNKNTYGDRLVSMLSAAGFSINFNRRPEVSFVS